MKNNLADLSNHLFNILEELNDASIEDPARLEATMQKAKAMCGVASQITDIARAQLSAIQTAAEFGLLNKDLPALIGTKDHVLPTLKQKDDK